jgi:hypothetical protein
VAAGGEAGLELLGSSTQLCTAGLDALAQAGFLVRTARTD